MKIRKALRYFELILLVGIILTPIIFYSTPLSIDSRPPKIGLKEGDVIQLTIKNYSFDYNLSSFENYNVTAGIYLNPILDTDKIEEGKTYEFEEILTFVINIKLFEGNTTSQLQFDFQINEIYDSGTWADITFLNTSSRFQLSQLYIIGPTPFFNPSLAVGLTFTTDDGNTTTSYIHWRDIFLFSTKRSREALNWYSKNSERTIFDFARNDKDTFTTTNYNQRFFSSTTYILRAGSSKLQEVNAYFEGTEILGNAGFYSNITRYLGIPSTSYWNYNLDFELRYFRGGEEI
ncbi:MAG: hypothetical protein ACTSO5_11105 [Candidatus Heimdallarchaeaceae archaeon]